VLELAISSIFPNQQRLNSFADQIDCFFPLSSGGSVRGHIMTFSTKLSNRVEI
jgi:hypothetical protein